MNNFKRGGGGFKPTGGGGSRFGGGSGFGGGAGRGRGDDRDGGRPAMHKAICARCENSCEVPFKPNGVKPIFCNDCFGKDAYGNQNAPDRAERRPSFQRESFGGDRAPAAAPASNNNAALLVELKAMNSKLDALVKILTPEEKPARAKKAAK